MRPLGSHEHSHTIQIFEEEQNCGVTDIIAQSAAGQGPFLEGRLSASLRNSSPD